MKTVMLLVAIATPAAAQPVYVEPSVAVGGISGFDRVLVAGRIALGFHGPALGGELRGGGYLELDNLVDGGFLIGGELESTWAVTPDLGVGARLGAGASPWTDEHTTLVTIGPRLRYRGLAGGGIDVLLAPQGFDVGAVATVTGQGKGGLVVAGAVVLLGVIYAIGASASDGS
jgi:hypothetical protein